MYIFKLWDTPLLQRHADLLRHFTFSVARVSTLSFLCLSRTHGQVWHRFKYRDLPDKAENLKSELSDSLILLEGLGQVI